MKRKARKKFTKKWQRIACHQGSDILIGLVTGIITNLLTDRLAKDTDRAGREPARDIQRG
jgi:hypothetical protein